MEISRDTRLAVIAGLAILAIPPFLFPYPPFHDLIAFIGMQSYPPKLSYGPTHYYGFQLTYFLHHLISRLCTDIGFGTQAQGRVFYLFHALGYFTVIAGLLRRFVANPRYQAVAILGGAMAFTDGMFGIGGPLPFSLAGVLIMFSVLLISEAREDCRPPNRAALVSLALLALLSHPFAAPILMMLYAVNFVVTQSQRVTSAVVLAAVAAFAVLIGRDSPETVSAAQLWQMFDPNLPHIVSNFKDALTWDATYLYLLFGERLPLLNVYVSVIAILKLGGALTAVVFFRPLWKNPRLRFLLALELAVVALFATAVDAQTHWVVPQWPWRIWSIANPLLYCFPLIAAAELVPLRWPRMPAPGRNFTYAALVGLTLLLGVAQLEVLAKGRTLQDAFEAAKRSVVQSGAHDAVVTWSGAGNINPFYLRSAPYLLFSDTEMLRRNLLFVTDWHAWPRHNTHIPEVNFASGRPHLVMEFLPSNGTINAVIHGLDASAQFSLKVHFGDRIPRTGAGEPLLTTGSAGDANILFALAPSPNTIVLYLDAWGAPWVSSPPIAIDPQKEYSLDLRLGGGAIKVLLDGVNVWERSTTVRSVANPVYGRNPVGGTMSSAAFSGTVKAVDAKP